MNSDMWMAVRAYTPTALAIVGAFVLAGLASSFGEHDILTGMARMLLWGSAGSMALGGILFIHASVRLYRAEQGHGLLCHCGGLLGREIDGRYGPYRRCMRCSHNVPQREYSRRG